MSHPTVQLELPPELIERAQQLAHESNRSLETVLVEGLEIHFGTIDDAPMDAFDRYTDEQLWAIVNRPFAWRQDARLRDLTERGKMRRLSASEETDLEKLVSEADHHMLLRSKALLLLKQRGHRVEAHLQLGT